MTRFPITSAAKAHTAWLRLHQPLDQGPLPLKDGNKYILIFIQDNILSRSKQLYLREQWHSVEGLTMDLLSRVLMCLLAELSSLQLLD